MIIISSLKEGDKNFTLHLANKNEQVFSCFSVKSGFEKNYLLES